MTTDIASKHKSAWVRGGTAVTATSASDAASQAGLNWTVREGELQAVSTPLLVDEHGVTPATYIEVPKKKAIIREDSNSVIGIVGSKYKIVQNMEVFNALDTLVDSGDARYCAAGEYNNGSNIWMLLEIPQGVTVANDPHAAFLLVKSSHDGSSSVVIKPVIERLFCANQVNGLISNKTGIRNHKYNEYTYRMSHTTNQELSINDIRNITQLTYTAIQDYELTASALLQNKMTREQAVNFFKRVWALPTTVEDTPYDLLTRGERKQQTIAKEARAKAWAIYNESETQENIRGTAFGAWHAVVEFADHYATGGAERLAAATLSGRNDRVKTKALSLLVS
jgi:phage/plasmid-like protein (TIGR03299 family)